MFDIIVRGALVVDGSGGAGFRADVGIREGRFAAVEPGGLPAEAGAGRVLDGTGLVLAPGFMDIHGHSDAYLLAQPDGEIKLRQGVTLDVLGNCGISLAPLTDERMDAALDYAAGVLHSLDRPAGWRGFGQYLDVLEQAGPGLNAVALVGHGNLRIAAMGFDPAEPGQARMDTLKGLLADSLDQGAAGMSLGLIYAPGVFSTSRELAELGRVLAAKDRLLVAHIRNESNLVLESVEEMLDVARATGVKVHISHLKVLGEKNLHLAGQLAAKLENAVDQGVDVTCDVYPYHYSSTTSLALLPPWALEGGWDQCARRLRSPADRDRMRRDMEQGIKGWENNLGCAGWDGLYLAAASTEAGRTLVGGCFAELAARAGKDPFDFLFDFLAQESGAVTHIAWNQHEDVVARFLRLPMAMVGSDGVPRPGRPHPRLYGSFPRIFRRFVRELGTLELAEAVRKMTALPTQRLGIANRGLVRQGFHADAALFDPAAFADTADFDHPRRFPVGLAAVLVNGRVVLDGEHLTDARPGMVLRAGSQ